MEKKEDSVQKLLTSNDRNKAEVQPHFLASDGSVDKSIIDNLEKEYFIKVFKKHKGKISDIAEYTGLNRRTILNKMKKFSIKKSMFKER